MSIHAVDYVCAKLILNERKMVFAKDGNTQQQHLKRFMHENIK